MKQHAVTHRNNGCTSRGRSAHRRRGHHHHNKRLLAAKCRHARSGGGREGSRRTKQTNHPAYHMQPVRRPQQASTPFTGILIHKVNNKQQPSNQLYDNKQQLDPQQKEPRRTTPPHTIPAGRTQPATTNQGREDKTKVGRHTSGAGRTGTPMKG